MNNGYVSKAYLVGYYGMQNTGDDALMTVAASGAKRYLHSDEVVLSSPSDIKLYNGGSFERTLTERQRFPGQNRLKHYLRAIDSQRVIFGGGSVFQNAHDIDMKRDMMMLSGGRSHLALGVGLGPFVDSKAERSCARFLNECEYVGVRDPYSFDIAKAISPKANVELTFDLAPQMLALPGFELQSMGQREGIAVCLCPHERLAGRSEIETKRLKRLANALDTIQFYTGEKLVFVDFNGHSTLGDAPVHRELASYLPSHSRYEFIHYDANPLRVLQRMASFRLVIGMRLHAAIFGYIAETPVLSLNYHRKCTQWGEQIGMPAKYHFDIAGFDPEELVNQACLGFADGFNQPAMSVKEAFNHSMKNWRVSYEESKQTSFLSCYSAL